MKQFFCDCCGKQVYETSLTTLVVNGYSVDLCSKCELHLKHSRDDAINKADVEFMKTMKHSPLGFKYNCE